MTRESKLALIIGFVLILVVGVLVSDHLSPASSAVIDENSGLETQQPMAQLPTQEQNRTRLTTTINDATPAVQPRNPLLEEQPIVISQATTRQPSLLEQMRDSVNTFRNTETPMLAAHTERSLPDAPTKRYTVESGDSLYAIAREILGDGDRWGEIHQLNMKLLGPDPILQPGMILTLPGRGGAVPFRNVRTPEATTTSTKPRTYTVQSGDALSLISQELLGTSKRAKEIAELNGLKDLNDIRIGMVLKIPAR